MDVKLYLALAGSLGAAYVAYNLYNKPRTISIPTELTRRICQQIKHQMMIVCITYSKAMKKIRQDNAEKIKGKEEEVFQNFRNELSQIYVSKENLILKKYAVSRETYGKALERAKRDKQLLKNTEEIINMMERAIQGNLPDFTVVPQALQSFNKDDLAQIYKNMVTLIAKKVTHKLQEEVDRNKHFNPNSDEDFRNAIRELQIYDVKVQYLKESGFKEEWGCPNEVFFKYLEGEKSKDEAYQKKVVAYEKCYQKIIELVSVDPKKMNDRQIEEMFEKALISQPAATKPTVMPVVQPARVVPVEAPKTFTQPARAVRKSEPVDEDAELEAMMMNELLSRSQEPVRSVSVNSSIGESIKLGMTSSEIQNDWEKNASLTEKPENKYEEATEEIAIGEEDQKLIKKEIAVAEEALKEQANDEEKKQEPAEMSLEESNVEASNLEQANVEAPGVIVDAEPVPVVEEPVPVDVEPVPVAEEPVAVVEQVVIEEEVVIEKIEEVPVGLEESNPQEGEKSEEQEQEREQQNEV